MNAQPANVTRLPVAFQPKTPMVVETATPWERATQPHRQIAAQRHVVVVAVLDELSIGVSLTRAVEYVLAIVDSGNATSQLLAAAEELGGLSGSTVKRWVRAFQSKGKAGLLPDFKGRTRSDYGWEADAIAMYNIPSKPGYGDVAFKLRQLGFDTATNSRVMRYLKSMPATLGKESPARLGKHYHRLQHGAHKVRDLTSVLVGEIYQGDGHTVDAYVAHPNTGKPYRPELTWWIDVRSSYIVGWYLSEAESAHSSLFALSRALVANDHVPAWLHIDNGSGFRAKLMNDESVGFYSRFDIGTIFSLPGNPRGKGQVEHSFKLLRNRHDKFFDNGQAYCGHDMAQEVNRRLTIEMGKGKRKLLSLDDYRISLQAYIDAYHATPQDRLDGLTPAQMWERLDQVRLHMPVEAVIRPREERVVRRYMLTLHGRQYKATELMHYDGVPVQVEYDLHNDAQVWVYDANARYLCTASLINKIAYLPESRLEEGRAKRLKGQEKRLQRHLDEAKARSTDTIESPVSERVERLSVYRTDDNDMPAPRKAVVLNLTDFEDD